MSDDPNAREEGFYWVVLGENPPEIAYWERGEWWLAGVARPACRRRLPMGTIVRVSCQRVPDWLSPHHHRWHQGGNRPSVHSRWRDADPTSARLGFDR